MKWEVRAMVENVLAGSARRLARSIFDTQGSDRWEMKIQGPNMFERLYTLEGVGGQHEPRVIASIVSKMVPGRS